MKKLLMLLLTLCAAPANAEDYLHLGGVSYHTQGDYNGFNYGIGAEREYSNTLSYAAGWYHNSERRGSTYVFVRYTPKFDKVLNGEVNMVVGAISGYRKSVSPMLLPSICWTHACALFIPKLTGINDTNVFALQFRIKI